MSRSELIRGVYPWVVEEGTAENRILVARPDSEPPLPECSGGYQSVQRRDQISPGNGLVWYGLVRPTGVDMEVPGTEMKHSMDPGWKKNAHHGRTDTIRDRFDSREWLWDDRPKLIQSSEHQDISTGTARAVRAVRAGLWAPME